MAKVIAFHLPQYHVIPENEEWWGVGFTDWTNVKSANKIKNWQYQPRFPKDNDYYDLSDPEVLRHQTELAKEYGVYGFCFYHYWFNGYRLLDKPLNNLLEDSSIDIPFCFCWANEPWARTWDGRDSEVLVSQKYGGKDEWSNHYSYLSLFFSDERYIKIDNKPMIVIYKTMHIPNIELMISYWNDLAIDDGFSGIHLVEMVGGVQDKPYVPQSKAVIEFEPNYTMAGHKKNNLFKIIKKIKRISNNGLTILDYDKIWTEIIERNNNFDKDIYFGAFVDWDNTPRKKNKGVVFKGTSPEKFEYYLNKQISKTKNDGFVFINAWNEWAEGTYLEPDDKYGFAYLNAIRRILDK